VPPSTAPPKPMHKVMRHKRMGMRRAMHRPPPRRIAAGNRITARLNREELARVTAGNTTAPPPPKP
jgi:hypothetical protein